MSILKNKMAAVVVIVSAMFIGASMTWQQRLLFVGGIAFGLVVEVLPDLFDRLKEAGTERWRLSQVVKRRKGRKTKKPGGPPEPDTRELVSSSRQQDRESTGDGAPSCPVASLNSKQIRRCPHMKTIVTSRPVMALEIDEEGTVAQKSMQLTRQGQLENTLLDALYPGIRVATV